MNRFDPNQFPDRKLPGREGVKPKQAGREPFLGAEKTASWGGLPGKAQPKNRSGGTTRLKIHPKSEGL